MTGPAFHSRHKQLEEQYDQIAAWSDDVAERARALGIGARGNLADLAKAARLSAAPGLDLPAEAMFSQLLSLHEGLVVQLRADSEACAELHHDAGTADFLTGLMEQHEKLAWMLRAELGADEEAPLHAALTPGAT